MYERLCIRIVALASALFAFAAASAQNSSQSEAVLRFDEAQREEVAEPAARPTADTVAANCVFAYKLNRKRVDEARAYDAVTLWNIRRVRIRDRRMRLSDSTRRERVQLLKFFIEQRPKRGTRPHLLGNVAGSVWSSSIRVGGRYQSVPPYIAAYTLRDEYDAARKAAGGKEMFKVPKELWHDLPRDVAYVLDGMRVPGAIFQFIDGLILRTLEIRTDAETLAQYGAEQRVVVGDTYPNRIPLVILNGATSSIVTWLQLCSTSAFTTSADVPMCYYFIQPVEAVQLYGRAGKYGAIYIELAK